MALAEVLRVAAAVLVSVEVLLALVLPVGRVSHESPLFSSISDTRLCHTEPHPTHPTSPHEKVLVIFGVNEVGLKRESGGNELEQGRIGNRLCLQLSRQVD